MINKLKQNLEMGGRIGVVLTMAVIMNRTQWYQDLPFQTLSNAGLYTWIFATGLALSLMWILIPLMNSQIHGKVKA